MSDIWHSEPAPGAVVVDLTRPGSMELVIEIHRMDKHKRPTDELEAVIRLDPFAKMPKYIGVRPRRTYKRAQFVYFAFPIFNVQHFKKESKRHGKSTHQTD